MTITENKETLISGSQKIMDKVINKYGYGLSTWKTFSLIFFILALEGFHLTFVGNMIISIKAFFEIEESDVQLVSSFCFLSVGFGSIITGYITERFKRMHIIYIAEFVMAVGHVLLGVVSNMIIFSIIRVIIGFCIGVAVPLALNLFAESLPIRNRSMMLTGVWFGFGFGQLFNLILMYFIMPNNEPEQFHKTLLISSSLSIVSFLLVILFLKDSPRNLLLTEQTDKAFEILDHLNGEKLNENERAHIIAESKGGLNEELKVSLKETFNKDMRRTTILLIFIWVLNSLITYGPMLITSLTLKALNQGSDDPVITQQILIGVIYLPSNVIGGLISEIPYLGRNKTTILCLFIAIIFLVLAITNSTNYQYHFSIYLFLTSITFSVTNTYGCEIYPTKVRDIALGFLFFCTRVGGFGSQILYIYLNKMGTWVPYYVTLGLCVLNIILVFLLPVDTYARALDEVIEKHDQVAPDDLRIEDKSKNI
jgi:MFS family permease